MKVVKRENETGALVLFSGEQDSTVCLAYALDAYARVETLGFDYGQRHGVELECRTRVRAEMARRFPAWASRLGPDHVIDIGSFGAIGETALTSDAEIVMLNSGLPSTFVAGRNLVFFVYAAALGYRRGLTTLIGGMCETDYSGYPDCRDATLQRARAARSASAPGGLFTIETPLMWRDQGRRPGRSAEEPRRSTPLSQVSSSKRSHTCYRGERGARHDWGYGCGGCPACDLRARGFAEWQSAKSRAQAASR